MKNNEINILAISGSLRSTSANTNILRAIAAMVPQNIAVNIWEGLDSLPHFNPELEEVFLPVVNFRQKLKEADAVIFSTPEYAFGVPGVLKNALDWVVSSGELNGKPVAAIGASPLYSGGEKALASLFLTLTALGTDMGNGSALSIGDIKNKMTAEGEISDHQTLQALMQLLEDLIKRVSV